MSIVLVDTSVWIDHFRGGAASEPLDRVLLRDTIFLHPWAFYEVCLGSVSDGARKRLARLPRPDVLTDEAVWRFVERFGLVGNGIGWVDCAILAAAHSSGMALWTLDDRLADAARKVELTQLRL